MTDRKLSEAEEAAWVEGYLRHHFGAKPGEGQAVERKDEPQVSEDDAAVDQYVRDHFAPK